MERDQMNKKSQPRSRTLKEVGPKRELREWLVIEDSWKHGVFAPESAGKPKGYIPRDVAEELLGRKLGGNQWFTPEESRLMRVHPEWRRDPP